MYNFIVKRPIRIAAATRTYKFSTKEEGVAFMLKYGLMDRVIDIFVW